MTELAIPATAAVISLYRINAGGELLACEPIEFHDGAPAVETTLRRAAISGRVEVGGKIRDHFADLLDRDGSMVETVALDADSYRALKTRWMPTRIDRRLQ